MKHKRVITLILALIFLCGTFPHAVANSTSPVTDYDLADVRAIALNTPRRFQPTSNWVNIDITKVTPLYDLETNVIAYCVDMQNAETDENAYVFVNADKTGYPILQYSPEGKSPYFDVESEQALYLVAGRYCSMEDGVITELATGETISLQNLLAERETAAEAASINEEQATESVIDTTDYSALRADFIEGSLSARGYDTKEVVIKKVPNWQWYKGCAPTAVAMQIANLLPSVPSSGTSMISTLAGYMNTTNGSTQLNKIANGAQTYIYDCGFTKQTLAVWQSVNALGFPRYGSTYNPYSAYTSEIDLGRAVCIQSENATVSTPGYANGWDSHMITGVGYSFSTVNSQEKYVIVHTTNTAGGKVYIPIFGTALGSYGWFKIVQ